MNDLGARFKLLTPRRLGILALITLVIVVVDVLVSFFVSGGAGLIAAIVGIVAGSFWWQRELRKGAGTTGK